MQRWHVRFLQDFVRSLLCLINGALISYVWEVDGAHEAIDKIYIGLCRATAISPLFHTLIELFKLLSILLITIDLG